MIGFIWNTRGMGKHAKILRIADLLAEHKVDFVGLQERIFQMLALISYQATLSLIGLVYRLITPLVGS